LIKPRARFFYVAGPRLTRYENPVRIFTLALAALLSALAPVAADTPLSQTVLLAPPSVNQPVEVGIGFQLFDVVQIEETTETFEFSGILTVQWKDERQAFDPATEGVPVKFYQGGFQFNEIATSWYPEVSLLNSVGAFAKGEPLLRIFPDGTSILVTPVNATAKSELKLRRYPFDSQNLRIFFGIPGYAESELKLSTLEVPSLSYDDIRIPQWTVLAMRSMTESILPTAPGSKEQTSVFVFELDVKRQSAYIMRLVVLPLFLVVVLSWSVFWMDRASVGDRMSVSFVGLLTAVAYQIVLGDIMPHISYLTPVNVFVNISFMMMCASIVVNLIVGELNRENRAAAADAIDNRCKVVFPIVYAALLLISALIFALAF
jgi:hypothetical protein